jgi:hypothetical protein
MPYNYNNTAWHLWIMPLARDPPIKPITVAVMAIQLVPITANVNAMLSAAKYMQYVHQLLCSLPAAMFHATFNMSDELNTIPGLTTLLIGTHLSRSTATTKCHMHQD